MKSMDDDIKSKVVEDTNELDRNKGGLLTIYLSITKYMVASNMECREVTEEWIHKFNILTLMVKM